MRWRRERERQSARASLREMVDLFESERRRGQVRLRSEMEGEGLRDGGLRSDGGEGSDWMERRSAMG